MSWKHIAIADCAHVLQAVADVAPGKVGAVMAALGRDVGFAKGSGSPQPPGDVLESVLADIRAAMVARHGEPYVTDLYARIMKS